MDILEYTYEEVKKNLALLENHLKQSPFNDKFFCEECIKKHILILKGLSEEGLTACIECDTKKFELLLEFLNKIEDKDYQKEGIELAKQIRRLRKKFISCNEDNTGMKDKDDVKEKINDLIEDLHAAPDKVSQDRISYGLYLLHWVNRGRKCSDA